MENRVVLGIDIGGSGVKGAPVDLGKGDFAAERVRIETPTPSTPENIATVVAQIVEHFADQLPPDSPIGITVPAPVLHGVVPSMANLDQAWVGVDADQLFTKAVGRPVHVFNDADAAGVAEVHYGAAKDNPGLVILTTLGTGIGTALIHRGLLVPNSELGHLEIDGKDAEKRAAASVKEKKELSYKDWAKRLQVYYSHLEDLLYPDLILVGGGVSKNADKFLPLLDLRTPIIPAVLENKAGIIGAAWLAADAHESTGSTEKVDAEEERPSAPGQAAPARATASRTAPVKAAPAKAAPAKRSATKPTTATTAATKGAAKPTTATAAAKKSAAKKAASTTAAAKRPAAAKQPTATTARKAAAKKSAPPAM